MCGFFTLVGGGAVGGDKIIPIYKLFVWIWSIEKSQPIDSSILYLYNCYCFFILKLLVLVIQCVRKILHFKKKCFFTSSLFFKQLNLFSVNQIAISIEKSLWD